MSGHVFHPGHLVLHGITVVVETRVPRTFVGRYDTEDESGVHLLDAGVHDPTTGGSQEEYLRKSLKFGVRSQHKHVLIPRSDVVRITRLSEFEDPTSR
jgi:hypothetical protein